jgi:hypothetical protein
MTVLRRRSLLVLAALLCLAATGCVDLGDPMGHEDDFKTMQKRFTQYVRWGKVHEASVFVVEDQREEFLSLAPELTDIRFTDYEITKLDYGSESAHVEVMLRGYRLSQPVERVVHLAQQWDKAEDKGWQVRLELAELKSGLGSAQ